MTYTLIRLNLRHLESSTQDDKLADSCLYDLGEFYIGIGRRNGCGAIIKRQTQ